MMSNKSRGPPNAPDFETCFTLVKRVGEQFLPAYIPIVERRCSLAYGERERAFQAYRRGRYRLLLWSGLCFAGLTINNAFLILDKIAFPALDLSVPRTSIALLSMMILLYGLIWDTE